MNNEQLIMNNIYMLKKIFLALCAFVCIYAHSQSTIKGKVIDEEGNPSKKISFRGYSGGMMLHTGYLAGGTVNMGNPQEKTKIQGMPWGIGGCLRFHFGKHLRIGGEGYTSTLHYGKNKSYTTLGWGGLLVDCQWKINNFIVFIGGTIGGGSVKNITILNNVSTIKKDADYRKYGVMVAAPFAGMEYAIARRIRLISKVNYVFNISQRQPDFATGIRVHAGVVFFHGRW
jgi:hypothetical protein